MIDISRYRANVPSVTNVYSYTLDLKVLQLTCKTILWPYVDMLFDYMPLPQRKRKCYVFAQGFLCSICLYYLMFKRTADYSILHYCNMQREI